MERKLIYWLVLLLSLGFCSGSYAQEATTSNNSQYYLISINELESLQEQLNLVKIYNNKLQQESSKQKMELTKCQKELETSQAQILKLKSQCEELQNQLEQAKISSIVSRRQLNNANELLTQYKKEVESTLENQYKREKRITKQRDFYAGLGIALLGGFLVSVAH